MTAPVAHLQRLEDNGANAEPDNGVCIAYSVSGAAETALIFIHGGMSDRSFWDGQHAAFAERFRVIALDLAGHGESGQSRQELGIPQFGRDVAAVMDAECVSRAVLIGNSLEARQPSRRLCSQGHACWR